MIYRQILQLQQNNVDALHLWGLAQHQTGEHTQAYMLISKAISISPYVASFHNNLGEVCRAMNSLDEAADCYKKALSLQPEFPEAQRNIGLIYLAKEQIDQAVSHLRASVERYPDYLGLYWALGQALMSKHQAEEAIVIYSKALERSPLDPTLICSKGVSLQTTGALDKTIEHYRQAIAVQPNIAAFHLNLALVYQEQENFPEAVRCLQRALELNPGDETTQHTLAAFQNITPDRPPISYIRKLFDSYADNFDKHLVTKLEYGAPKIIAEILRNQLGPHCRLNILDAGCGTGLFGEEIKDIKKQLVGIDLSTRMIAQAKQRGIYDQLIVGDLLEYLAKAELRQFDLIAATDVFNYVGNLSPVVEQASRILAAGGWFLFTIEAAQDTKDFTLDKTGRYQHSKNYIDRLGAQFGFIQISISESPLRKESGKPVPGLFYLLKKLAE